MRRSSLGLFLQASWVSWAGNCMACETQACGGGTDRLSLVSMASRAGPTLSLLPTPSEAFPALPQAFSPPSLHVQSSPPKLAEIPGPPSRLLPALNDPTQLGPLGRELLGSAG